MSIATCCPLAFTSLHLPIFTLVNEIVRTGLGIPSIRYCHRQNSASDQQKCRSSGMVRGVDKNSAGCKGPDERESKGKSEKKERTHMMRVCRGHSNQETWYW